MNILCVFFHFPPISGGGVIVTSDIANSLAKKGHKVSVLVPDIEWNGPEYNPEMNSKIDIIRVKVPSKNNIKVAARRCKKPLVKKGIELDNIKKFDFIFSIFHPFHFAPNAAIKISEELKIPSIIKIDDAIYEKSSGLKSIQRKIEKMISSSMLKKAGRILVSNEETKKIVSEFYKISPNKIKIIPNGIETKIFYFNQIKKTKLVIFSGVLYNHRGLDILIKSIPLVLEKKPEIKFLLVGEGPEKEKLQKMVSDLKINKNVEFKKWIERKEIIKILADASVGIGPLRLTSVTKGALPIKVLEYMASSLPLISQKDTLPQNILIDGENGFFINDEEELASKIIYLFENEDERKKMGQKSHDLVQDFDWGIISEKIILEYENLKS